MQQQECLLQHREELLQFQSVIEQKKEELGENVQLWFLIQPCFRCQEFTMKLLEVSPNARSVHYQCGYCGKKGHASAGTKYASSVLATDQELRNLILEYVSKLQQFQNDQFEYHKFFSKLAPFAIEAIPPLLSSVVFQAPAAPLPYEQTTRSPISEAVRSEVWRRDVGQCVQCRSKQNLQFDHIIPVAKGGATTAANLQLLCQPCNDKKGKQI